MKDDSTRRDFLKAAGLIVGASLFSATGWSQEEDKKPEPEKEPENPDNDKEKEDPDYNDLFENEGSGEEEETRACPQCGALMYRQGRTWTCENCGYSYVE